MNFNEEILEGIGLKSIRYLLMVLNKYYGDYNENDDFR